jgi:drug/metabolite transporter (DMT)-like permease
MDRNQQPPAPFPEHSERNGAKLVNSHLPVDDSSTDELHQQIAQLQATNAQLQQELDHYRSRSDAAASNGKKTANPIPLELPAAPLPVSGQAKKASKLQLGLGLVLLSTMALSIHNVIVRMIIGQPINLLGLFSFGGFIQPSLGNSILILWLRMLVVVPMMTGIAGLLYPQVWQDIKRLVLDRDRRPLLNVVGSGAFLFLSQVLIYIAIAQIGPGVAVTILFMYPLVTVPLAWWLFGDKPTRMRLGVMLVILFGVILVAIPSLAKTGVVLGGGVVIATLSGIAFALYLIFMQLGFKKLHPVPVSVVQFLTILFLTSLSLALPIQLGVSVVADKRAGFLIGSLVLGALTLVGYLANNFGVRYMGAGQASIVASSGPVITALLAAIMIQTQLHQVQVLGILLVTIGVTALSFERMKKMATAPKPTK